MDDIESSMDQSEMLKIEASSTSSNMDSSKNEVEARKYFLRWKGFEGNVIR
jgi:hypothetical protein